MSEAHFNPDLFRFLKELKKNNNRDWFQASKQRYEDSVKQPMLRFIADFGPHLKKVSPRFLADPRPTGGSMFRIYRDVRFSEDKSPYKTHASAYFKHERAVQAVHVPGFYLHLEPAASFCAGGLWHPDPPTLLRVRRAMVENPGEWKKVAGSVEVEGDRLARPPKGFATDHPLIEDLKLKDYIASARFSDRDVCGADFPKRLADEYRKMLPLVKFLAKAVALPW